MVEWIKIVILGIVEGITEFLPISSTGHLIVSSAILNFQRDLNGTFEIFIQLGAVIAVVAFYRVQIWDQVRRVPFDSNVQHFWLAIIIASIPAAIVGFLIRDWVKEVLFSPVVVAITLILGGIAFIIIERRRDEDAIPPSSDITDITFRQAILVGFAQTLALIPGVSRSGASIFGGLYGGMSRPLATTFSFYLAIPVLGGATILDLVLSLDELTSEDLLFLIVGAVVSGIVAWFAIGWLLRYVSNNNFVAFGYYRIGAGALILVLVLLNVI